jgi:plasmid stabilization system protein ParE
MKVHWTEAARADLDDILAYTAAHFPSSLVPLETRIRAVTDRVAARPYSAQSVSNRPGVRVVPLIRYPFRIYYRIVRDRIEILHVHHTSRRAPD